MGTWGPGIFDGDLAADVRNEFRELAADGDPAKKVTTGFMRSWRDTLADPEDGLVAWLALAAAQWECGRLDPRVKKQALKIIKSGGDLDRWQRDAPDLVSKRDKALQKLAKQLAKAPPKPKRLTRSRKHETELEAGDLLIWRLETGKDDKARWLPLWVHSVHKDKGGRAPVVVPLSKTYARKPTAKSLAKVDACWNRYRGDTFSGRWHAHMMFGMQRADDRAGRYTRIARGFKASGDGEDTMSTVSSFPDAHMTGKFIDAVARFRTLVQCAKCLETGYKPGMKDELEPGVATTHMRDYYTPLALNRGGLCEACR